MRMEFLTYLGAIGITEAISQRIETIYKFYQEICPDEITDIFVTDYIKEDGSREYEDLWFFTGKYWMEAKQFIIKDDFDMTPAQKPVYYWSIQKQEYDFKKATEKSRIYLKISLDTRLGGDFKAAKENCDYLKKIFIKYVAPNLKD